VIDPEELRWIAAETSAARATVVASVQSLWRGYGEIVRVALEGAPERAAKSVMVKSVRPPPRVRDDAAHARKCASYDVELAFYGRYAARTDARCRVPALLASRGDADRWLLVLEDLDAAGFGGRLRRARASRGAATDRDVDRCLAWLAAFHASFLGVAPDGLWSQGTYWDLEHRRDELAAIEDVALREAAPRLDRALRASRFRTLIHGDAKPANFCFARDASIGSNAIGSNDSSPPGVAAVDFQWVGGGCGVRDVAYLACSAWDDGYEARAPAILDAYFGHLRAALGRVGSSVDASALEREWRALYPVAMADFWRFYAGWAPEAFAADPHARASARAALAATRG
jgi:hypothetical protein